MRRTVVALLVTIISANCWAETPPPAYQRAAMGSDIPVDLLWAVARVESNFKIKIGTYPWPWTLNIAGAAKYFRTREEACSAALKGIAEHGSKSVDIGLTQQNWGWVGVDFYQHPCDALEPNDNLRTASIRLRECYETHKDWIFAAGCYHRPAGGEPARIYRAKIQQKLKAVNSHLLASH